MNIKVNEVYRLKDGPSVKEGYGNKKVKIVKVDSTIYAELLEDVYTYGDLKVPKGTVIHLFSADGLVLDND